MSTAVFIKSESCDYYLYCFELDMEREEALDNAEGLCPEERQYWMDIMVENSQ